jgi:hypothetical protein
MSNKKISSYKIPERTSKNNNNTINQYEIINKVNELTFNNNNENNNNYNKFISSPPSDLLNTKFVTMNDIIYINDIKDEDKCVNVNTSFKEDTNIVLNSENSTSADRKDFFYHVQIKLLLIILLILQ